MALKAGRVGVAPDQVDDFGQIKSDATSGYTKQEADAKFETQTAASAALAEKQSVRLNLPIELLSGSALTVEDGLHGINSDFQNFAIAEGEEIKNACTSSSNVTLASVVERVCGNIVGYDIAFTTTEAISAGGNVSITIPRKNINVMPGTVGIVGTTILTGTASDKANGVLRIRPMNGNLVAENTYYISMIGLL